MTPSTLCLLPFWHADLAARVESCGLIPVIDLRGAPAATAVPPGAWVRVRRAGPDTPGDAGILAEEGTPLAGRPCWREIHVPMQLGEGWSGAFLRGQDSGGLVAVASLDTLRDALGRGTPVMVDWQHPPWSPRPTGVGIVVSDTLAAWWRLPATLSERLPMLRGVDFRVVSGVRVLAPPASPVVARLARGEMLDVVRAGGPADASAAWPLGLGTCHAHAMRARFGAFEAALRAYAATWDDTVRTSGAMQDLPQPASEQVDEAVAPLGCAIAIVGIGCRLPGGVVSPAGLHGALVSGFDAIGEVPKTRWDPAIYWDPDPSAPDRTYARIGAFITDDGFSPRRFRIPPAAAEAIDPVQRWALDACADALEDAGYAGASGRSFDRTRCAVILGNSMGGETGDALNLRVAMAGLRAAFDTLHELSDVSPARRAVLLEAWEARVKAGLPPITEDSMPGELSNVVAGRVANALDLGGPNYTTDAACASSLAALQAAVRGLVAGDFDMALTGGSDRTMGVATYVKFCKIGALSPDGSRPFDAGANGFVMGEGCAVFVLKRLEDARAAGDRVLAVIRGIGASSDGRGKGITAPNPVGQSRALTRAYEAAGIDPCDVDYVECHGTSTVVGDKVEVDALAALIGPGRRGARGPVRIGSIKSNLGHLKSAAGAAGLAKVALAIHHRQYLPQIRYTRPRADLDLATVPFQVQTMTERWESAHRFAGLSSFGFGGTNFHVVVSDAETADAPRRRAVGPRPVEPSRVEPAPNPAPGTRGVSLPEGVWAVSGDTHADVSRACRALLAGERADFSLDAPVRVAAAFASDEERRNQLERAAVALEKGRGFELLRQRGVHVEDAPLDGSVAFLFTGQGSQYVGMGMGLAAVLPLAARTFAEADEVMTPLLGRSLTSYLRPDPALGEDAQFEALRQTEISQPATLAVDIAILRVLASHGVRPHLVAGHSLGEYGAAVAAGVLSFKDALVAVSARGREMAAVRIDDTGKMASIAAPAEVVSRVLAGISGYVVAANKNTPTQTVIAGESAAVEAACEVFRAQGLTVHPLPVSHAFHSRIVAPATEPLRRVLDGLDIQPPRRPFTTNVSASYYPTSRGEILDVLAQQVAAPVEWIGQIERMYADGARVFVECGPKRVLTNFCGAILEGRPHRAIAANHPRRGEVESLRDALAALLALGVPVAAVPSAEVDLFGPATVRAMPRAVVNTPPVRTDAASVVHAPGGVAGGGTPRPSMTTGVSDVRIACSGASLGVPGGEMFANDTIGRMLRGENRIERVGEALEDGQLARRIVRVTKDARTGEGAFQVVEGRDGVIRLAGRKGSFSLDSWGVDPEFTRVLDITTQLAVAAGFEALRDAGIPLVRTYRATSSGRTVATGWALPESMRDDTGVILASAFPGYDWFARHLASNGDDGNGIFDRRFLFQILGMGHAQFAQLIGARGPNTGVNAACASTTQAIAIAQDWIRVGRARRVIVLGADDVTSDALFPWIGSGFLAAGAATTKAEVAEAALPFDARRHGMIPGMGAVALVLEPTGDVHARGMQPVAELLASEVANSAYHGSRLDQDHVSAVMRRLVQGAAREARVSAETFASRAMFMSHETYTPARGGSAAAEMAALGHAFGDAVRDVWIANTKGYTGHAMGAGIEDVVAVKALQYQQLPPIANLRDVDPELGVRRFAKGGSVDLEYAIRLSAGFGSQVAIVAWRAASRGDARMTHPGLYRSWLHAQAEGPVRLVVECRQLRAVVDAAATRVGHELVGLRQELEVPSPSTGAPVDVPAMSAADPVSSGRDAVATPPSRMVPDSSGMLGALMAVIAQKTGYDVTELEAEHALEADLGIDTVKQAEIFGEMRERFGVARDDSFRLADHPTIGALAGWLSARASGGVDASASVARTSSGAAVSSVSHAGVTAVSPVVPPAAPSDMLHALMAVIARKTGYDVTELEAEHALEADLGIDTVKQAEIFGEMRERFGVGRDDSFRLADHPTIGALAGWLSARASGGVAASASAPDAAQGDATLPTDARSGEAVQTTGGPLPGAPGWMARSGLPDPFRMRRTVWQARRPTAHATVRGMSFRVLGSGPLADTLRAMVSALGVERDGAPDVVIDAGGDVESAFRLARTLDATPPRHWVCVVEPTESLAAAQASGARAGLTRGLGREWKGCSAHVVDLGASVGPDEAAEHVLRELSEVDGAVDVRLDGTTRWVGVLEVDAPPPPGRVDGSPVVVLTGGMRGITARVAQAFAEAGSCTLVLVGRTAPGPAPLDEDAARRQIRARLEASGERVVPRRIEEAMAPLRVAEEARRTVAALRAEGATVEVRTCDLADPVAVATLVREVIARHGRVDVCIHGAGVEESRKLADKDERAFHRVFDGKAIGGLVLAGALPATCHFVSMGSIAGRFGNEGQVDYAAANEAMARVCAVRPRSVHLSWTAWAETGMAARGGMDTLLESRGIDRIPAAAGAALVRDLVAAGAEGEWVVSGRLGDLVLPSLHPLLDGTRLDGDAVLVSRALSVERDPWISDHAIGGVPVLPGVIGLEWMLAAARLVRPSARFGAAEDVRFLAPLKVHRDGTVDVDVRAEPDGVTHVRCVVRSRRTGATGRVLEVEHYTARFPVESSAVPDLLGRPAWPEERLLRRDIYRRFFHGPAFQVLEGTEAVADDGLIAGGRVLHAPIAEGLIGTPLVLEAAFQAAGLHRMVVAGVLALPSSIERVVRVRDATDGEPLRLCAWRRGELYDVDVLGAEGPVLLVRGFRMADLGPMDPRDRFPRPGDRRDATPSGPGAAGVRDAVAPDSGAARARSVPDVVEAWAEAGEAASSLPPDDLAWLTARGTPRRHADRLAGQLAAQRAVEGLLGHRSFRVLRRESGEPWVEGADVRVSISHVDGRAVAVATRAAGAGVDLERIVPRDGALLRTWYTPEEQARFGSDRDVTIAWAVKEAVLKALGSGMRVSPRDVEVLGVGSRAVQVRLHGEAAVRLAQRGNPPLHAAIVDHGDGRVVATVLLAA
ncbi:MAG: hypothetical protein RLZZ299_2303 [Pseudomonadota bacterium]